MADIRRWVGKVMTIAFSVVCISSKAFAGNGTEGSVASRPAAGGAIFWVWLICFLARKRAIGGWLLYYFITLYLGLLVTLVMTIPVLSDYDPGAWENTQYYVLFLLTSVPSLLLLIAQAVLSLFLISKEWRDWKHVALLKKILLADLLFSVISIVVETTYWPEAVFFSYYSALLLLIWLMYFSLSHRVKLVFRDKLWSWESLHRKGQFLRSDSVASLKLAGGPLSWTCANGHSNVWEVTYCSICKLKKPIGWRCVESLEDRLENPCNHMNQLESTYCEKCGSLRPDDMGLR